MTQYISSPAFRELKDRISELALADSIYSHALQYTNYDYAEALHILTFTTVPYNKIPVKIPLLNIRMDIPLVSAPDSIFYLKNENLPRTLFWDSPSNEFGDKDKLAHFFGSAFLSYSSHIFDFTKIIGIFVEDFEEKFFVQDIVDPRDLRTDLLGYGFGKLIKKNKKIYPSHIFLIYNTFYLVNFRL